MQSTKRFGMNMGRVALIAACAGAAAWLAFTPPAGRGAAQARFVPPTTAILDLDVVIDKSERKKAMEQEVAAAFEKKKVTLETIKKEGEEIQAQLQLFKTRSDEYKASQRKLAQKQAELEMAQKQATEELEQQKSELFGRLIEEIRAVTAQYAAANGIELVLQRKLLLQPDMPAWEGVFFHSAQLDITDAVVEMLNGKQR